MSSMHRFSSLSSLAELPSLWADAHGTRRALVGEETTLTFAELDAASLTWAKALRAAGYGPGHHIGLLAGNSPEWLATAFGVWRSGATLVPLSTFTTERELRELVTHAELGLLLLGATLGSRSSTQSLEALASLASPPQVHEIEPGPITLAPRFAQAPAATARSAAGTACILYTSGTTGRAKGVMLGHTGILATVGPTAERTGLTPEDSLLSTLPLFWVAGLVIRALPTLATGCALILPKLFRPEAAIRLLREHRPTALHLRPPQVGQILAHLEQTPELARELFAPVTKGGGRAAWYAPHMTEARLITGYGMTEMSGYVTALDWRDSTEALREGIGTPLPGVEIRIVDETGQPLAAGLSGEIQVRGPGRFLGYYGEPPETGGGRDGWFRTGDLGCLSARGEFRFQGRSKDLLRVKGINVSPVEVESVLASHPDVEAAYVVGLPADGLDQQVVALIVAKSETSEEALEAHARRELSHYKRPSAFVFLRREDVPLGGTSKPQRAELAALATRRLAG